MTVAAGEHVRRRSRAARTAKLALATLALASCGAGTELARQPDVPYEPTPPAVVRAMLDLAEVGASDVVYDLGCGDGRIVVEAGKRGARGVGVDIDPERVREAQENVRAARVGDRVEIVQGDLFETQIRDATAVMLYLWPHVNLRLRPKLLAELRPGTRVVSHSHDMGDWKPEKTITLKLPDGEHTVFYWVVPSRKKS
jgi:SAM-dependent methyltransferase